MTLPQNSGRINPKKFSLLLMIGGMTMLFMALTSAYIVRQAEGNWLYFDLPKEFLYSVVTVIASSITMWLAYRFAKKDEIKATQISLLFTLLLGSAFVILQISGWYDMADRGIYLVAPNGGEGGGISGSFIIVLAWLHLLHMIGGIIYLAVVFVKSLLLKVHKKNLLSINLCNTYWHFVGILWIYLFLFFKFSPQF